jgi:hypothetical protein
MRVAYQDSSYSDQVVSATEGEREEGSPWAIGFIICAGVLMVMSGLFQSFQGVAAIIEDEFLVLSRSYAFDLDASAWGWIHLVIGIAVALAGIFVFTGNIVARLIGIVAAMVSMVTNFLFIPYYPVWAILIISIDIGIIWALTFHGREFAMEP